MVNEQLINPKSIAVIGGSNDISKPGGKVLKNIIDGKFKGDLYVVNPKDDIVQGLNCYKNTSDLPDVDLAIIAVGCKFIPEMVEHLAKNKKTKAFIILSAGFSEENEEGRLLEEKIVKTINDINGCLIGPNCIGFLNSNYSGVFTTPIPKLNPQGCDFISGSGATAVFIMEAGIPKGLSFASVYSVGNSAQMGVEEVLKYLDESFDPAISSKVKILYLETVKKPDMLLKHASSLVRKGCRIAAIKAGSSEAGSRAASSHTGALATSDVAVDALFRKAGIVRCFGRDELTTVASLFMHKELQGKNMAIITHAGGPAVMLTDALSNGGMEIPHIEGKDANELLTKLNPGSSVANPIDFLATGNAEQLGTIIDYVENKFSNINAMVVIFGSPGLFEVYNVYEVLKNKMRTCKKPIYPVLPSIINAKKEIDYFISEGGINFPDEVTLGNALVKVYNTSKPSLEKIVLPSIDSKKIRSIIDNAKDGYLNPSDVQGLLDAAGIPRAGETVVRKKDEAVNAAGNIGYPVVMKVVGPVHKSEVGGVAIDIKDSAALEKEFERMIKIKDV
ncbi:MAG: acetate--CoA ligase family protein, partial [Bacteroidales bacterium]|nr:acetate--CoA ligase family protein [Bacteroidales bacterium]